jgi:hypothetical protein
MPELAKNDNEKSNFKFKVGDVVKWGDSLGAWQVVEGRLYWHGPTVNVHPVYDLRHVDDGECVYSIAEEDLEAYVGHITNETRRVIQQHKAASAEAGPVRDTNPKTLVGRLKTPLELVPPVAKAKLAEALADGARKYGAYNWREKAVSNMVYLGAAQRHIDAYLDGEEVAEDSGVHHLAHAMACFAIVLDAEACGACEDTRPAKGGVSAVHAAYHEREVARAKQST